MSEKKMNYCEWSKCSSYNRISTCTTKFCGESCYTLYGHCNNIDFDDNFDYESSETYKKFRKYEKYLDSLVITKNE